MGFVIQSRVGRLLLSTLVVAIPLLVYASPAYCDLVAHGSGDDNTVTQGVASVTSGLNGHTMRTVFGVLGPQVTVTFSNGDFSTDVWDQNLSTGPNNDGLAEVPLQWRLSQIGDTHPQVAALGGNTGLWTLQNLHASLNIVKVEINAEVAGVAFDNVTGNILSGDDEVSLGSNVGWAFDNDPNGQLVSGTYRYSHQIDVGFDGGTDGDSIGDLYGILTLMIDQSPDALGPGESMTFWADTDLMSAAVPEASQILAFSAVGLVCATGSYLRKRRLANAV